MTARTTTVPGSVESRRSSGIWRDAFGRLIKNRLAIVGGLFIIFLAFLGILGPRLTPWPYDFQDTAAIVANNFQQPITVVDGRSGAAPRRPG